MWCLSFLILSLLPSAAHSCTDEEEGGEDEDEDGIPDFEDLDPDDEVAMAADGEQTSRPEGEGQEGGMRVLGGILSHF